MDGPAQQSVHDNWLYAESADRERRRIVLHTVYPHVGPGEEPEWTDVVFEGVVTCYFGEARFGAGPDPVAVLADVAEQDALEVLRQYAHVLGECRRRGWPLPDYDDVEDLAARLQADGARCYAVDGVVGVQGFVFAAAMVLRRRPGRAEPAG